MAQPAGDPQRQAYRAQGGRRFKQAGQQRQAFQPADDQAAEEEQKGIDKKGCDLNVEDSL